MLKQRRMVAEQVAGALFEAEAAIDAALSKTAQLTGVMPALRSKAGLSALIGQDALEHASQAIAALAEARRAIAAWVSVAAKSTSCRSSCSHEKIGMVSPRTELVGQRASKSSISRRRRKARPITARLSKFCQSPMGLFLCCHPIGPEVNGGVCPDRVLS